MATAKTTTAKATENTAKKARKPREKKEKCILLRGHDKYPEFMQAYDKGTWVLIDPESDWKKNAPRTDSNTGKLALSLAGHGTWVTVVAEGKLAIFNAIEWLKSRGDQCSTPPVAKPMDVIDNARDNTDIDWDYEMENADSEDEAALNA